MSSFETRAMVRARFRDRVSVMLLGVVGLEAQAGSGGVAPGP